MSYSSCCLHHVRHPCTNKIQNGDILIQAYGLSWKMAVKRVLLTQFLEHWGIRGNPFTKPLTPSASEILLHMHYVLCTVPLPSPIFCPPTCLFFCDLWYIRIWEIYRIIWVTGYRRHMGCRRNSFRWRDQTLTAYVLSRLLASRHGREGALDRDAAAGHLLGNEMLGFQLLVLRLARDGDPPPPAQPLSGYCSLSVYLHSPLPSSLVGYCYILLYRGVSVNSSSLSSWGLLCPCASYALCWMPCCFFFIWGHYINRIKSQWVTGWSKKWGHCVLFPTSLIWTYMISLDVLLRKFVVDTVINCFTHMTLIYPFYFLRIQITELLRIWNVLPHDTDFSSLAGFKHSLSTNILQKFLKVYFDWFYIRIFL